MPRRTTTDPTPLPRLLIALATALLLVGLRPASAQETEAEGPAEAVGVTTGHPAATGEAHEAGGHGGGGHGGEANILEPQPTLAIYTLIVFLLLLAVLWRFAWGPLSKALHDREHKLENAFIEAERARNEAAELLEQHRRQMDQVQDEVRKIMDEANRKAQVVYDDRLKQAQADAQATADRAHREIAAAKDEALGEIWTKSADLAATIARRVLPRELNEDDHRRLVQSAIEHLPAADGREGQPA